MLPDALVYIFGTLGIACLGNLFVLSRTYKEKANIYAKEEMSKLLLKKETYEFMKKIKAKELTFEMVSDFYSQFAKANKPKFMYMRAWRMLLFSGISLILSTVLGKINFSMIDILAYEFLFAGLVFLLLALYAVAYLEREL